MDHNRKYPESLLDYVNQIKLNENVLCHLEETKEAFHDYFKMFLQYDKMFVFYSLIDSLYRELSNSSEMEGEVSPKVQLQEDLFFDNFQISHARIHRIHKFVCNDEVTPTKYRDNAVKISGIEWGEECIYFLPPEAKDVPYFMKEFGKVYRAQDIRTIHNDSFIKSALMHALFIKIHPYSDGNGRTGRMIHNIKFTEILNKDYRMNLKLCPLNLSRSMRMNRKSYHNRLNAISFDGETDDTEAFNRWFDFCLMMADEQIYYAKNHMRKYEHHLEMISANEEGFLEPTLVKKIEAMRFPKNW